MKKASLLILLATIALTGTVTGQATQYNEKGYNPMSVEHIHMSDIMYRKTVIRALDLRTKQNQPLFSHKREISRLVINAVKEGTITPYKTDSLKNPMTIEEFLKKMEIPSQKAELSEEEQAFAQNSGGGGWGSGGSDSASQDKGPSYYFPSDIYQMEIKEDLIFDKQRSRLYYDLLAFTFYIPADHPDNIKGIQLPIASFSYKELHNKLFEGNPKAIWYNRQNERHHRNLTDAFELRLFDAYIIMVSNPENAYLSDVYGGPKAGIKASKWAANRLMEKEHHLWEF